MRKSRCLIGALTTIFLLESAAVAQPPIRWEPTLDSAQRLAGQTNRLVLIQFWAPWCGVCRRMETQVFSQPTVANDIVVNYVPVKINADNFPMTAQQYGVTALPTTVVTTPQGQPLDSIRGRMETAEFMARLNRIATAEKQRGRTLYAQIPTNAAPPTTAGPNPAQAPTVPGATGTTSNGAMSLTQNPGAQPPVAASQPTGATPAPVNSRYADFMRRTQSAPPTPIAQPSSAPAGSTAVQSPTNNPMPIQPAMPPANVQTPVPGPVQAYPPSPATPMQRQASVAPNNPILPSPAVIPAPQQPPAINPPLGLDGYCSVTLSEKQQWVLGDRRWGAIHRGRTYLFCGPQEQRRFLSDPDRYAPAVAGNDVVLATEQGQSVPGMREHGVFFGNQVYLFSNEATLEKFARNPAQYATRTLGATTRTGMHVGQPLQ